MLDKFLSKRETPVPKHVVITVKGCLEWSKKNKEELLKAYQKRNTIIKNMVEQQIKLDIPILTFLMLSTKGERIEYYAELVESLTNFFEELSHDEIIHSNKIKVSIIGKWYNLPGKLVDAIKHITEQTREYDSFFLNFCLNYNGQDEILDAVKLICKKISSNEINVDNVTKELIKDNLYSSYFIPPDIIIETGLKTRYSGILLWDSVKSNIIFTKKPFPDFSVSDFLEAIR